MDTRRPPRPSLTLSPSFFDREARDSPPITSAQSEPLSRRSSRSFSSDCSPASPVFSASGHHRMSSASTTVSSSPALFDTPEPSPFPKKSAPGLPDLVEDPLERDGLAEPRQAPSSFDFACRYSQDVPVDRAELSSFYFESYYGRDSDIFSDSDAAPEPQQKRRKSGESPMRNITDRVLTRLPSLSRRRPRRNRSSTVGCSEPGSGVASPTGVRSRSNSRARSLFRRSAATIDDDVADPAAVPSDIGTIAEDEPDDEHSHSRAHGPEPVALSAGSESEVRASTPLLPHLVHEAPAPEASDVALQAPPVVPYDEFAALALSPSFAPRTPGLASPALSSQPSLSAMHHSHASTNTASSTSEKPSSFAFAESSDEWSQALGHADFSILPAPYMPEECSREACQQLLRDWREARNEFARHLCNTGMHYGSSSKTSRLTREKWEWLDSIWRRNYDQARATATKNGEAPSADEPDEPAPVAQMPAMDGKFPIVGDQGIIGPMEQGPPRLGRRPSKKRQLLKMIGGLQRRGRSSSAV